MTNTREERVARLAVLEKRVRALKWREPVPDDLQSDVRMEFNEALAGGPNMNGDAGPTLSCNHALDCVWAAQRIAALSVEPSPDVWEAIERFREALEQIRGLNGQNYESDRAWALGMQLRAKVALDGWLLPDPPKVTVEEDRA